MLGIVIFLESTSYLFGSYHRSKLKKRAFSGLLGILSWWWVAALASVRRCADWLHRS